MAWLDWPNAGKRLDKITVKENVRTPIWKVRKL